MSYKSKRIKLVDSSKFRALSRKRSCNFLFSGLVYLLRGDMKKCRRYLQFSKSLKENIHKLNYPTSFLRSKKKLVVYTVLYGDYDEIKPIKIKNPLVDYFIFTDQQVPENSGWVKKDFYFAKDIGNDPVLKNRFLKMHPHLLFPEYEYSIYLDAVLCIELDIVRLMARMGNCLLGLFEHHKGTNCLYKEAELLKNIKRIPATDIDKQMKRYRSEGFPNNFGFFECTLLIRRHNAKTCINIMEDWWKEFYYGARRDQLSFMYAVWKNGLTKKEIASLGATYWIEPVLSSKKHK